MHLSIAKKHILFSKIAINNKRDIAFLGLFCYTVNKNMGNSGK